METSVKELLKEFLSYLGIGQKKFEQIVGLSNGYVNNIRVSIQPDKVQSIALHFPELNTGWLLTGEGNMLKQMSMLASTDTVAFCLNHSSAHKITEGYIRKDFRQVDVLNRKVIDFVRMRNVRRFVYKKSMV